MNYLNNHEKSKIERNVKRAAEIKQLMSKSIKLKSNT